jgi:cell division septal protein FtsQ
MKKANRRNIRTHRRRQRSRWWSAVFAICTLLALFAIANAGYRALLDSPYFKLKEIRVVGVSQDLAREVSYMVHQTLGEDPNTLSLSVRNIRQLLEQHPRLRTATVEVAYPHALVITAVERTPTAILAAEGFYLLARDGVVIQQLRPRDLRNYALPYVTGVASDLVEVGKKVPSAGLTRALEMLELLHDRNPELYSWFSEVNIRKDPVTELENVTARLRGGMEVLFGTANPSEKLALLDLYIQQQQQGRDPFSAAYVDLRVPNQIIYLDRMAAAAARSATTEQPLGSLEQNPSDAQQSGSATADRSASSKSSAATASQSSDVRAKQSAAARKSAGEKKQSPPQMSEAPANDAVETLHQVSEPANQSERRIWRPRLPFKMFSRRAKVSEQVPQLLAPVDSSDSGE